MLGQSLKSSRVKSHTTDIISRKISEIEDDPDQVRLSIVIGGVIVSIDDVGLSIVAQDRWEILEHLSVNWIAQDVVSVDALQVVLGVERSILIALLSRW